MKANSKKSQSLSLVGGCVREIHFKIGGDKIPTVREKPIKSLRRLYSISLTDRHRGTEVQKVAWKGLKSSDKTCLPRKDEGLVLPTWSATPIFCGPYRCTRWRYLVLNRSNSIATNNCVSGSEYLLVFQKWVYIPILETYSTQYPHW